jgi:hypothetical protein
MRPHLNVLLAAAMAALPLSACLPLGSNSGQGYGSTAPPGGPYEQALDGWLNRSEADLIAAWGVPERSQRLTDGGQALQFVRTDGEGHVLCTTLFTSDMTGLIRTWTFRGSACRAPRLGVYGPT